MPTISMFYGVIVNMYAPDTDRHHLPHVHARYNWQLASEGQTPFKIEPLR